MEPDAMHIIEEAGIPIVELLGEHDLSTSPALRDALHRVDGAGPGVVVDLTAASFIDSAVIGALADGGAHVGRAAGLLAVVAPEAGHPRRVLDLVGLDRPPIRVFATRAEALDALNGGDRASAVSASGKPGTTAV